MSAQHTPGPWDYFRAANFDGFAIAPHGRLPTLAAVSDGRIQAHNFPGQTEANARLIAAAPELLAALRRLETLATTHGLWEHSEVREARAAIAKAEGRS